MKIYKVKVNGKTYRVELDSVEEVKSKTDETKKEEVKKEESKPASATTSSGDKVVVAPLQGNIVDIKVKVGDQVKKGQTVAIIEAMKLENEVSSPFDGEVVSISVSKGNTVASKDVLLTLK